MGSAATVRLLTVLALVALAGVMGFAALAYSSEGDALGMAYYGVVAACFGVAAGQLVPKNVVVRLPKRERDKPDELEKLHTI